MSKRLLSIMLLIVPASAFAFAAPRNFDFLKEQAPFPSWVGISWLAILLSAIAVTMLVQSGMLRLLSKTIRPRYVALKVAFLLATLCMIVWTGIASHSIDVFLFNLHGILAGLLAGLMCSKTRKPITADSIWRNTMFYLLLHGG